MFKVVLDWIIVLYAYVMVAPCSMKGFLNIRFEEYREKANDYLKNKMFAEALEFYDKCLKINKQ